MKRQSALGALCGTVATIELQQITGYGSPGWVVNHFKHRQFEQFSTAC